MRRATRELPLGGCLILTGLALFFGGGGGGGSLPWIGGAALVALVLLLAAQGLPGGWIALAPLAALVAWLALSIWWSTLGSRSWDYADRGLVYLAFAALGLWLAGRTHDLALGLAVLLGGVAVWALAGKVLPPLASAPDPFGGARLRDPVGLWNQLALLGGFALPLALWLATSARRSAGVLLAYVWLVALVLTLSRGGIAVAVVITLAWLALDPARLDSLTALVAAALPAGLVAGVAFALPGVTGTGRSHATRWHHGLVFGGALIAGAAFAAALSRAPAPRPTPSLRRAALGVAALLVAAAVVVGALKAGSAWRSFTSSSAVGNGGGRFGSASGNFRWVWWKQAWHGFEHHVVAGTGGGSFQLTNLRYRTSYLDVTTEPHDLLLQFLSELGLVGLVLLVAAAALLLRPGLRRRGHELTLALVLPAYLLHALVDVDWDFLAVSAPAFLVAGALAGRPAPERRPSAFAAAMAAGAAILAFAALLMPWLGERWSDEAAGALGGRPAHVVSLAKRARAVDPLLVEPLWWEADAEDERGRPEQALALFDLATTKQPENAQTWLYKARFELAIGCARAALLDFYRFNDLDRYERPSQGPNDYLRARALVNSGAPTC